MVARGVALRRALHQAPELTWEEEATAARIRSLLDGLGISWTPCAGTGTLGRLAVGAPGKHVALRADIDALPIVEETGLPWASQSAGKMHACGHDGHIATLMTAARWLAAHEAVLPGPVTLLFQPAEEGGHGALRMIEEGALEGCSAGVGPERPVDEVFGWHNWPAIPFGRALCPDGAVMGANGTFGMELIGRGGHGSQPEATRDPVLAAASITTALQQIVSRRLPPQVAAVVSVTWISAPRNDTVIPDRVSLGGTVRAGDTATRERLDRLVGEIATNVARGFGVELRYEPKPRYGATVNEPAAARRYRRLLAAELGPDWQADMPVPIMASEDFSYYLRERPGAFALVGAGRADGSHREPCHSPRYDFNDDLIAPVARLYAGLAGAPLPPSRPAGFDEGRS